MTISIDSDFVSIAIFHRQMGLELVKMIKDKLHKAWSRSTVIFNEAHQLPFSHGSPLSDSNMFFFRGSGGAEALQTSDLISLNNCRS